MEVLRAIQNKESSESNDNTDSDRKPLKTIRNRKNRKRQRSPDAEHNHNKKSDLLQPSLKKQKISSKKSSKSKEKSKTKRNCSDDKKVEETDAEPHFLSKYTSKTIKIKPTFEADDEHNDTNNDKSRKLKFKVFSPPTIVPLTNNENNSNNNGLLASPKWIRLSDIFYNAFKYSSTSNPTANETKKEFIDALKLFLKKNCISHSLQSFYTQRNKKYYISEKGFCILLMIMKDFDETSIDVQHFCQYRYFYRYKIFGTKIAGIDIKKPQSHSDSSICTQCCLEDIDRNFNFNNPCDCASILHLNCNKIKTFVIPNDEKDLEEWFCPFCIESGLSMPQLIQRRNDFNTNGEFEVEKVIDYDSTHDKYTVTWRNYPKQACCETDLSLSFIEAVQLYWKHKKMPEKAQNAIDLVKQQDEQKAEDELDDDEDIDMVINTNKSVENDKFIVAQLHNVMDNKYIIRRQKYTKDTYHRYKSTQEKYRKWLQKEVKNESLIGMDVKREMNMKKMQTLPKYHLRSVNKDWDCDLPRIHDIIINFLRRDWKKWSLDVSSKSFVIAEIIDPENPAKKYGTDQGVHDQKAYGLFAIEKIVKDTLLFEYSGCVKPIGLASAHLDHLETELDQTTLFDLIGHLDSDRNKLFWGKRPNDQLVIDPSQWHNEGVYMNDYRDRVMDDPDDDEIDNNNNNENDENHNNSNQNYNQTRKQNVKFYEVLVNNWPRVFAVAIEDIDIGQELLGDYGSDFWSNFRVMMKRQKQLSDIKKSINDEWQAKFHQLQVKCNQQEKEIEKLKKEINQ